MNGATDGTYDNDKDRGDWKPALRGPRRRGAPAVIGHAARLTAWSLVHFAFGVAQQVAELAAPLLIVVGIGWAALPRILGMLHTGDDQMEDILDGLRTHVPSSVAIGGHVLTPSGLVVDGILLMALAAALSTASAVLARELYRR